MKKLFLILTTVLLLIATACSGAYIDPGMMDQQGGGFGGDKGGNNGGGSGGVTSNQANPIPLTIDKWYNGSIARSQEIWYSFNVSIGTTYYVFWNDVYQGDDTKKADIKVSAYYSSGTDIFTDEDNGWSSSRQSFTAYSNGTVRLKVTLYSPSSSPGTFAIAYSTNDQQPLN
jgi:hypothetical protein